MKRFLKGIIVLLLFFSFVGCGEKEVKKTSKRENKNSSQGTVKDIIKRDNLNLLENNGYSLIKNSDLEFIISKDKYSMQFIIYNKEIKSIAVIQGTKNPTGDYCFINVDDGVGIKVENSQIVYSYNFDTGVADYGNISDEELVILVDMNAWYKDFLQLGIKIDVLSKEIIKTYYN